VQPTDIRTHVQCKRNKELVKNEKEKQVKLNFIVPDNGRHHKAEKHVNKSQQKFQANNVGEMFFEQKIMLGNVFVVVICNAHIEQNIQQ
jgi:hypothetical protein